MLDLTLPLQRPALVIPKGMRDLYGWERIPQGWYLRSERTGFLYSAEAAAALFSHGA